MRLLAVILVLTTALSGYAQTTANAEKKSGHFYWSASKAKEIPIAQTLTKETRLTDADKKELVRLITAQVKATDYADDQMSAKEFEKLIWKTRVELVDLNGDGVPEVLAQGFDSRINCSATGNCEFLVFQKIPHGFKMLLDTYEEDVGGVESYTVKDETSKGFRDMVLASHGSAFEKGLLVYRFDGKKYRQSACYTAHWDYPNDAGMVMHKNPVISRCGE